MSFTIVVCPDCKQRHKVPDTATSGKKVQCTKSGPIFPIALGGDPPEAGIQPRTQPAGPPPAKLRSQRGEKLEEDSDEGEYGTQKRQGPPRRRAPIQPKQGGSGLLIVLILGGFGLLVLVCGGGILLLWLGSRKLAATPEPKLAKEAEI